MIEPTAAAEIAEWRREVDRLFSAGVPRRPEAVNLESVIARFRLSRQPFDDLIDGVEMDLHRSRYETFDELATYCRRVASAVGLICVEIFGCRDSDARDYAINLGQALQLTNIIRDIGVDLRIGRVYLPQEDLERFGVDEPALEAGRVTPAVRALLAFECERARQLYAAAARALPPAEASKLIAAEIMGGIYFEILQRIERRGYDVFSERDPRPQAGARHDRADHLGAIPAVRRQRPFLRSRLITDRQSRRDRHRDTESNHQELSPGKRIRPIVRRYLLRYALLHFPKCSL